MVSGEQTLATFRAILNGFVDLDQAALIEPYRERYFAVVGDIWRDWSTAMAQDFAGGIYAAAAISAETVRATDDYIAAANPPDTLRRVLTEGRDDVLRALRCRARDAQAADR
jgi:aminopeptidase N